MEVFLVTKVVDGDTFEVMPDWQYGETKTGNRVRIADYDAPELNSSGGKVAKRELGKLLDDQFVELDSEAIDVYGRLVANVYLDGQDVVELLRNV